MFLVVGVAEVERREEDGGDDRGVRRRVSPSAAVIVEKRKRLLGETLSAQAQHRPNVDYPHISTSR